MARPRQEIDFTQFEKLCSYMCTESEIADFFDVSIDTIQRRVKERYGDTFQGVYQRFKAKGKAKLRKAQFELAQKNAAMAIFLGKNWLGQSDKTNLAIGHEPIEGIEVRFVSPEDEHI